MLYTIHLVAGVLHSQKQTLTQLRFKLHQKPTNTWCKKNWYLPDDQLVACNLWLNQLWNLQLQTNIHEDNSDCHHLRVYTVYTFGNIIPFMQKGGIQVHSLFTFTLTNALHFATKHVQNEFPQDQNQMCCVQDIRYACMHVSMYLCMYALVYTHVICMYMYVSMYVSMYLCVCVCNKY